ncbi:unnamed protein product [Bursaphelenchus okinawaensis]|uniref:Poly(A) RNA polymerase mitochondrial-like central palm domain-containing protein n=1 Tax=Bursaphelenchus okinawaensis TaxID=465554 RepID=A0A811JVC9_9BILA|nr:unnamed protein product [Bursaphelenchus okinawaensis]CAG9085699.1 unnamed protein product [Bursaphelenchus okinawaensis]
MKIDTESSKFQRSDMKPKKKLVLRIYGFSPSVNFGDFRTFLENYGPIRFLKSAKGRESVTVQFEKYDHGLRLLNYKTLRFGNDNLTIHESDYKFEVSKRQVIKRIINEFDKHEVPLSFSGEAKMIRDTVELKPENVMKRLEFVARLNAFVRQFFDESLNIEVKAFGSTLTGFGLLDADLDLTFLFERNTPFQAVDVSHLKLKDDPLEVFKKKRIENMEWRCVSIALKAVFLGRLLKQYEEETDEISDVVCIEAARVPIITFKFNHISCDLSFTNILGMRKADLLKLTTEDHPELSNTLFFIRTWARCAGIFKSTERPVGCFSSYAFSILFFCYCQHSKVLGPLENNEPIQGIAEGTKLTYIGGYHGGIKDFVIGFFEFCLNVYKADQVLCPMTAQIIPIKEFQAPAGWYGQGGFRVSDVSNIQDPIETGHNITSSVTKENLERFLDRARDVVEALMNLDGEHGIAKEMFNVLRQRSSRVVSPALEKMQID